MALAHPISVGSATAGTRALGRMTAGLPGPANAVAVLLAADTGDDPDPALKTPPPDSAKVIPLAHPISVGSATAGTRSLGRTTAGLPVPANAVEVVLAADTGDGPDPALKTP